MPQSSFAKNLAALAISMLVALGLAEGVLRVYSAINKTFVPGTLDPLAVQIEPHGYLGFRPRPNTVFHYPNGTEATINAMSFRGPAVVPADTQGVTRIVLLGGSDSFGWSVPNDETIDAHMRRILAQRFPGRRFEVVNLGFDGYDSFQDLQRLKSDGVGLHPNVVIVNSGPNDVRNAWYSNLKDGDPRTLIWEPVLVRLRAEQANGGPSAWTRVKHYLILARIPGWVAQQGRDRQMLASQSSAVKEQPTGDAKGPPYPDAANYFQRNVQQIVDTSTKIGSAVLLAEPPSALESYAPDATSQRGYWIRDAKTTQAYRDELGHRMAGIAADAQRAHKPVAYIAPNFPRTLFLDDAHMTGAGYRELAVAFVDAIAPFVTAQKRGASVASANQR